MYLQHLFFIAASLGMTGLTCADDTYGAPASDPKAPTSDPKDGKYYSGYPICNVNGWNVIGGDYNTTTHFKDGNFPQCINDCRGAYPACQSVGFITNKDDKTKGACLFYDKAVKDTQLQYRDDSQIFHSDIICPGPICA
ncbi:hypothetical protein DSL72_008992 [Monilinia vaccinii-corymbosi]|uniref:Apple domain-containing protein n=1 Tax=Monilinia vaccinii-corymbosi TaxID=61207 RepID=A0A8A3PN46_9HELO|nr:hypothetical protein DSL72_008992 [Monilinia vaccinii-corymbosi]